MDNQNNNDKSQELNEINSAEQSSEQTQQPAVDWHEQYLRVAADFQNYKKRVEKERAQLITMANADVLRKLLSIVDDFDRALAQPVGDNALVANCLEGFSMIRKSLGKLLESYSVIPMADYAAFDPEFHEAIAHIPSPNHQTGFIVDVVEQGYLMNGVVLRPARVTVAQ